MADFIGGDFLDSFLPVNLSDEEKKKCKSFVNNFASGCLVATITHPLTLARTLFQFGYEPYPISTGRALWVVGRNAYYLPNIFNYLRKTYIENGFKPLYSGVDSNILAHLCNGLATFSFTMFIDRYYSELGGEPIDDRSEFSQYSKFRSVVRQAIRDTCSATVGTIVTRPFMIIMIRQIAQLIGKERKYANVIQSLFLIGKVEGPDGLFAGLIPQLIFEWITIWGVSFLNYGYEYVTRMIKEHDEDNEIIDKADKNAQFAFKFFIPMVTNTFSYPFSLVSTLMSIAGSGLMSSFMPYSPTYTHWQDAYNYLDSQKTLDRGRSSVWRVYKGPVKVDRVTGNIYASTSFSFNF